MVHQLLSHVRSSDVVGLVIGVCVFLASAYASACAMWPLLVRGKHVHSCRLAIPFAFLLPAFISADAIELRALAGLLAADLFFKLFDYSREIQTNCAADRRFAAFTRFLIPFPVLAVHFSDRSMRGSVDWTALRTAIAGSATVALLFASLISLSHIELLQRSFLLDHTVKFAMLPVAWEVICQTVYAVERCVGFESRQLTRTAYLSRTVGEFWRRFNIRVHSWLVRNVFRPAGGQRKPVRGLCLAFFVSALFHEVSCAVATSRIDGYQFVFFMAQAPAVIASRKLDERLHRYGRGRWIVRGATVFWMWLSSMLFFHAVDRVFPNFYAAESWLP